MSRFGYALLILLIFIANLIGIFIAYSSTPTTEIHDGEVETFFDFYLEIRRDDPYFRYAGRYLRFNVGQELPKFVGANSSYIHALAHIPSTGWVELPLRIYVDIVSIGGIKYYIIPDKVSDGTIIEVKLPDERPSDVDLRAHMNELRKYVRGAKGYYKVIVIDKKTGAKITFYMFKGSHVFNKWVKRASIEFGNLSVIDSTYPTSIAKSLLERPGIRALFEAYAKKLGMSLEEILVTAAKSPVSQGYYTVLAVYYDQPVPDGAQELYNLVEKSEMIHLFPAKLGPSNRSMEFVTEPYDSGNPDNPVEWCQEMLLVTYISQSDPSDPLARTLNVYVNGQLRGSYIVVGSSVLSISIGWPSAPVSIRFEMPDINEYWKIAVEKISYLLYPGVENSKLNKPIRVYPLKNGPTSSQVQGDDMLLRIPAGQLETNVTFLIPNPFHQTGLLVGSYSDITLTMDMTGSLPSPHTATLKIYFGNRLVVSKGFQNILTFSETIHITAYNDLVQYIETAVPIPLIVKIELSQPLSAPGEFFIHEMRFTPSYMQFDARPLIRVITANGYEIWTSSLLDDDNAWTSRTTLYKIIASGYGVVMYSDYPDIKKGAIMFSMSTNVEREPNAADNYIDLGALLSLSNVFPEDLGDSPSMPLYLRSVKITISADWLGRAQEITVYKYKRGWGAELPEDLKSTIARTTLASLIASVLSGGDPAVSMIVGAGFELAYRLIREAATADVIIHNGDGVFWVQWDSDVLNPDITELDLEVWVRDAGIDAALQAGTNPPISMVVDVGFGVGIAGGERSASLSLEGPVYVVP